LHNYWTETRNAHTAIFTLLYLGLFVFYHKISVPEGPKAVLTVQPDPSLILRGETFTLTCDILGEGWTYRWRCDDYREHISEEKEIKFTTDITENCQCSGCRAPDCSDWSDEVTLTVSGE